MRSTTQERAARRDLLLRPWRLRQRVGHNDDPHRAQLCFGQGVQSNTAYKNAALGQMVRYPLPPLHPVRFLAPYCKKSGKICKKLGNLLGNLYASKCMQAVGLEGWRRTRKLKAHSSPSTRDGASLSILRRWFSTREGGISLNCGIIGVNNV